MNDRDPAQQRSPLKYRDEPQQTRVFELSTAEYGPLDRKQVLVLEDDLELTLVLKEVLHAHSFQVITAKDGVEGLKHVLAGDFDAILCDLLMPNLPGDMFYLAVQRVRPHLAKRFIFMTGHRADPKWDAFARKVGALILWKPFQMSDLIDALHGVIRKTRRET
jgi:DNA-binding response OmpR family regulator